MIPVAIASPAGDCFGAYHPADGDALLLLPQFGYEALSTYRHWRDFAQRLADAGVAVLRLDLPGTRDAAGLSPGADHVAAWRGAVDAAASWLRARHGAVSLLGCRFGALLALDAVGRGQACRTLVLLDPPQSGVGQVRAFRARARMEAQDGEDVQAYGVRLRERTLRGMAELPTLVSGAAPVVLLAPAMPGDAPDWLAALQTAGARIETAPFAGRDAFVMRDSFQAQPPAELFERIQGFLFARRLHREAPPPPLPAQRALTMRGLTEQPVFFGPGLFGILCLPEVPKAGAPGVVIPSVGNLPRSGPGGVSTALARRLAGLGVASLRYDCAGVGDSDGDVPGDPAVATYLPHQVVQLSAAIDVLAGRGLDRVIVAGHCSGAYLGWRGAALDSRIVGVFAANLQILKPLSPQAAAATVRPAWKATGHAPRQGPSGPPSTRQRLVRGADQVRRRVQTLLPAPLWDDLRASTPDEIRVRRHLRRLVARGVRVQMVFGDREDESYRFHRAFGRIPWLPRGVTVVYVPGADHMFSAPRHRTRLLVLAASFIISDETGHDIKHANGHEVGRMKPEELG